MNYNQEFVENNRYKIHGENGWEEFDGVVVTQDAEIEIFEIILCNGDWIKCTGDHILYSGDNEIPTKNVVVGCIIDTCSGSSHIKTINKSLSNIVYDIVNSDSHKVYTNNIKNHQCDEFAFVEPSWKADEFWASNYPTISASKDSKIIIISTPNGLYNKFHEIYSKAEEGKNTFKNIRFDYRSVPGRDEEWAKEQMSNLGKVKFNQEFGCFSVNTEININNTIKNEQECITIGELYERMEQEIKE